MYYSRVDALRCYAVIAVLFSHFFAYTLTRYLFIGVAGVDLFFVISGFLITEILLRYKDSGLSIRQSLKKFYVRRFLRIFPIYYLYLIITALLFWGLVSKSLPYAVSYTVNFYQQHAEVDRLFAHLWSLSIEEQFYLFWPLLILVIPNKHILKLIVGSIIFSVFSRLLITGINHKLLTTSCMDAFGLGALFAYFKTYDIEKLKKILAIDFLWVSGIIIYFSIIVLSIFDLHFLDPVFRLAVSTVAFYLIGISVFPNSKGNLIAAKFLDNKNAIYIGQISYGIYIYHLLVEHLTEPFLMGFLSKYCNNHSFILKYLYYNSYLIKFPLYTLLTIGIASLSFKYLEKPISTFKNRISG